MRDEKSKRTKENEEKKTKKRNEEKKMKKREKLRKERKEGRHTTKSVPYLNLVFRFEVVGKRVKEGFD